tara:strand:- start:1706 stop:2215 length:510 start_codon:yes stop_codon:yes gene_type:complete
MNCFYLEVKKRRQALGLSQSQLAQGVSLSLPTIQRFESNRTHLSFDSYCKILEFLGLELELKETSMWNKLSALGVPIFLNEPVLVNKNAENLVHYLRHGIIHVFKNDKNFSREKDAVLATLFALKLHYPLLYREVSHILPKTLNFDKFYRDGRMIKLKRIALSQIGTYL